MNIRNLKDQPLDEIQVKKAGRQIKGFLIWLLKVVIIVGISYIILGPLITIVANSFLRQTISTIRLSCCFRQRVLCRTILHLLQE